LDLPGREVVVALLARLDLPSEAPLIARARAEADGTGADLDLVVRAEGRAKAPHGRGIRART
jgi:hypothetical protein